MLPSFCWLQWKELGRDFFPLMNLSGLEEEGEPSSKAWGRGPRLKLGVTTGVNQCFCRYFENTDFWLEGLALPFRIMLVTSFRPGKYFSPSPQGSVGLCFNV